jgi:hypothetical protein
MTGVVQDGPSPAGGKREVPAPRSRLIAALAAACAGTLLTGVGYAVLAQPTGAGPAGAEPSGGGPAPAAPGRPAERTRPPGGLDLTAVDAILERRGRAVVSRDRSAFLASVDPAARAAQAELYADLARLPLADWRQRADPAGPVATGPADWTVRVTLRYRLRGFDRADVARTQYLTFARRPATGLVIVGDGAARGLRDDTEIWDGGRLSIVRGDRSLVIGNSAPRGWLRQIAARLDEAVPTVTGVVGRGWDRRAVAVVPATDEQAGALAGEGQSLREIAALATVTPGPGGTPGNDRIVVSPAAYPKLNEIGRHVVLTHELTHVATHGAGDGRTPLWLIEGFADYVGYQGVPVSVRSAARELRRDVVRGRPPRTLPGGAEFSGTGGRLSQAYEGAWLACRMVAERYGEDRLVRLYRTAGTRPDALQRVLGVDPAEFTAMWRAYLREELS